MPLGGSLDGVEVPGIPTSWLDELSEIEEELSEQLVGGGCTQTLPCLSLFADEVLEIVDSSPGAAGAFAAPA
eukprot:392199-Alexandrium_andersonii.AAC.1